MQDIKTFWNLTVHQHPGKSVRLDPNVRSSAYRKTTVAFSGSVTDSGPYPARLRSSRLINFFPETKVDWSRKQCTIFTDMRAKLTALQLTKIEIARQGEQ